MNYGDPNVYIDLHAHGVKKSMKEVVIMLSKKLVKDKKITLYNRATRALEEEVVFERWFMDLFYGTTLGYWLTAAVLKRHFFSHLYGFMQRLPSSRGKIAPFIARHQINADQIE